MVQVMVVRVDIEVMIYEAMTTGCGRSVDSVLVVRVDIGVVIYEAVTQQCRRSVDQVLVVRVDIGVVIYEAVTPQFSPGCQSGNRSGKMTLQCQWFRPWLSKWI